MVKKWTWTASSVDFQEKIKQEQANLPRHQGIPIQDIMRNEETKEPEAQGPIVTDKDAYQYQDMCPRDFPFLIDAPKVFFVGRLEKRPVWAHFTIVNMQLEPFWFKVKVSNNEMFKVGKTAGKLFPDEQVVVPILYYPGRQNRPQNMVHYAEIHALSVGRFDEDAYETWNQMDRVPENSKRVFFEFLYHPNKSRTQAILYGKLLKDEELLDDFNIEDVTHSARQGLLDRIINLYWDRQMKKDLETAPEKLERKSRESKIKNDPRVFQKILANLKKRKPIDISKIIEKHENVEDAVLAAWPEYTKSMRKKGFEVAKDADRKFRQNWEEMNRKGAKTAGNGSRKPGSQRIDEKK